MTDKKKPSAEEIEEKRRLRAEKKQREDERRAASAQDEASSSGGGTPLFAPRRWSAVKRAEGSGEGSTVRVLSWNILAQGLVRRKLFPGSDCLKWKEREAGLCAEMRAHDWDIAAFQEVDKVEVHGPNLESTGRRYLYTKGYAAKQHGLMIAWRVQPSSKEGSAHRMTFHDSPAGSKVVYFDQESVGPVTEGRKGLSRVTRNIALFAALASTDDAAKGVIVATTHLFWHPMHAYERARQSGILKRALLAWKESDSSWRDWPIILAGDFNDQPHSATYKLMTGDALTMHNHDEVKSSSVVHSSVDEGREKERLGRQEGEGQDEDGESEAKEEEEEGEADDQMLKNCRLAQPDDGLLSFAELIQLHDLSQTPPSRASALDDGDRLEYVGQQAKAGLVSAYGAHYGSLEEDQSDNYFGSSGRGRERHDDPQWKPNSPNPHLGPCKE